MFRSTAVNFGIVVGIISLTLSPEAGGVSRLLEGGGSPEVVGARCWKTRARRGDSGIEGVGDKH